MLVIFLFFLIFMIMIVVVVVITFLHALNCLLFFDRITKDFHQIDGLHIFVLRGFQSILDPLVRFTAYIDQKVTA